jgi:hypothetical protein
MSSLWTNRPGKNLRLTRAGHILASLGFGAFAAPIAAEEPNLDYAYAGVLAGSGGKFTDSVERDAGLRLRGNTGF